MKYNINVNQAGVVAAGLHVSTDLVDWAILDYVQSWQLNPNACKVGDKVWLNYSHLINEMPLLGLSNKSSVSNRVKKLVSLKLIDAFQADDKRLYVAVTALYVAVTLFSQSKSSGVQFEGVHQNEQSSSLGVHENSEVFILRNAGVPENEHTLVNQLLDIKQSDDCLIQGDSGGGSAKRKRNVVGCAGFDEFWDRYPKKRGKVDAQRAWDKLRPSADLCRLIVDAVVRLSSSDAQWLRDGGAYVPNPATFLNGRRWEDEVQVRANVRAASVGFAGVDYGKGGRL